ncbi:MAG: hypothetical protein E6R03_06185 [Hyphomicrobiaceae bacterium]|nr:MAG: hypothetical protein E6R03_06185 [Hyphomicrobiaceae bacterium]
MINPGDFLALPPKNPDRCGVTPDQVVEVLEVSYCLTVRYSDGCLSSFVIPPDRAEAYRAKVKLCNECRRPHESG